MDDVYTFPLMPPSSLQERPSIDQQNLYSTSRLCDQCWGVLTYFAYVAEECKSEKSSAYDLDLLEVALHHENLNSLFSSARSGCHLCTLLSGFVKGPNVDDGFEQFLQDTRVEMCWSINLQETLERGRIQFAEMMSTKEREPSNYFTFARLQIWPAKEFGQFFTKRPVLESVASDSDGSRIDVSDISDATDSTGVLEETYAPSTASNESSDEIGDTYRFAGWPGSETASLVGTNSEDNDDNSYDAPWITKSSTGSASSQRLATQWLADCRNNKDRLHNDCCDLSGYDWLPTRLIDVRQALATSVVRLVSPHSTPDNFITDRRDRFEEGVFLKNLPRTFREAIEVADWFAVPWLWIDSLCIIQDSSLDWQYEALQMHSVYRQGYLNISADCAVDARDGLFRSRAAMIIQPLELELPGIHETIYLTVDERNMFGWINDAPLSQRAWVFQERHLSRRILHFTQNELVWECCAKAPYFASESFPNGTPLRHVFDNKPKLQASGLLNSSSISQEELYDLWEDVCQMYSEKRLSKASDKLTALFGLAKIFQERFPDDTYIAGMWLSTLPQRLLWNAKGGPFVERNAGVAPSWSWASIDGPIRKEHLPRKHPAALCRISYTHHGLQTRQPISLPQNSELAVYGYTRRVTIHDNLLRDSMLPPIFEHRQSLIIHDGQQHITFSDVDFAWSLDSIAKSKITEAYILFLTIEGTKSPRLSGLLLHETLTPATFERIGTFSVEGALVTALKYTVREDIKDWEAPWKAFKAKHEIGEPRRFNYNSSRRLPDGDFSDEDDDHQSDAVQDESDGDQPNASITKLRLDNLTVQSDGNDSSKGDLTLGSSDDLEEPTDKNRSRAGSEPNTDPVDDDTTRIDTADITAVLYAHDNVIDDKIFQRLLPRNINLV
ncbi:MAG: hypothetical protein Q9199_004626 [Rusavskia elegans]